MKPSPTSTVLLAFAALLALAPASDAATFRVDATGGNDSPSCGSAAAPCQSIQQAVNLASSGDTVLVATGTYTYQPALDPCSSETGVVCIVGKKLSILGGYPTGSWTPSDPAANPTVIDGEDFQRGVLVQRISPTSPFGAALVLRGFTIRRGRAAGNVSAAQDRRGGGLKAGLVESLVLSDVAFEDCVAAGADTATGDGGNGAGGGASVSSSPDLPRIEARFDRIVFRNNRALGAAGPERGGLALGGGLFMDHTNLRASDLVFENNRADAGNSSGDGLHGGLSADALGGGWAILSDTNAVVDGFSAVGNSATGGSSAGRGGVGAGGGTYVERSSLEIRQGEIRGNSTLGGAADTGGFANGGGLTAFAASVTLDRVALIANHATSGAGTTTKGTVGGGGAYLNRHDDASVSVTILNSIVADNRIDLGTGGGLVGGGGAGLFLLGNVATIVHTTLAENVLGTSPLDGQALSVVPHPTWFASSADIRFSIIADHTSLANAAAVKVQSGGSVTFEGGLFAGNSKDTNDGAPNAGAFSGLGTVQTAGSADFVSPGPSDYDYHLQASSPAVDEAPTSTVERDFDDTVRPHPRDLGADEYCSAAVDDLVLSDQTVSSSRIERSCRTIAARDYTIGPSADVLFQSGRSVRLESGFAVEAGARFQVLIELP